MFIHWFVSKCHSTRASNIKDWQNLNLFYSPPWPKLPYKSIFFSNTPPALGTSTSHWEELTTNISLCIMYSSCLIPHHNAHISTQMFWVYVIQRHDRRICLTWHYLHPTCYDVSCYARGIQTLHFEPTTCQQRLLFS